jgi:DNA-binding response OmpR family regulator
MLKLLVVDDEPGIREGLALGLGDLFDVDQAANGAAALLAIAESRPDLVLLDQKMDGQSGVRVLEQIRCLDQHVPVIMLSAVMDVRLAMHSMRLGAQDCLVKPFSLEQLRTALTGAMRRRPGHEDLDQRPFALQVAPLMAQSDSADGHFDDSRSHFILRLLSKAIEDSEGDLEIAAERLGLEKDELQKIWLSYEREGSAHGGISAAR